MYAAPGIERSLADLVAAAMEPNAECNAAIASSTAISTHRAWFSDIMAMVLRRAIGRKGLDRRRRVFMIREGTLPAGGLAPESLAAAPALSRGASIATVHGDRSDRHRYTPAMPPIWNARLLLLAATLCCTGCGVNSWSTAEPASNVDLQRRLVRDPGLSGDIEVMATTIGKTTTGPVAQITIRNRALSARVIDWRITWLAADGLDVTRSGDTRWNPETIDAGDTLSLQSIMPANAADFRFSIRQAK